MIYLTPKVSQYLHGKQQAVLSKDNYLGGYVEDITKLV
jgi:hypothetical protein